MKFSRFVFNSLAGCVVLTTSLIAANSPSKDSAELTRKAAATMINLPISFERNAGQTDAQVRYLAHGRRSGIFFTPGEVVLALYGDRADNASVSALRLKWIGANRDAQIAPESPLAGRVNYFVGSDPAKWQTDIPTYARVRYHKIYSGVDVVFYGKDGEIEYDLEVAPGTNLDALRFTFDGAASMHRARNGDLVLSVGNRTVRQRLPKVYQNSATGRRFLAASYVIHPDKTISYRVSGVDRALSLVIDPVLSYSTLLGGAGDDFVTGVAVDQFGRVYATGSTTFGFPTKNPIQGNQPGHDAFVTKFFADGAGVFYSTYLGGNSDAEAGAAIGVDRDGNAYAVGNTRSTDFPVTPGAFQQALQGTRDGFIAKLDPSGSQLVYSTLLGGSSTTTQERLLAMALDSQHRVYVTGSTDSRDFPIHNAFQPTAANRLCGAGPCPHAFVTRLSADGTSLSFSTYLGGKSSEEGDGIAVDSTFHAYVTGFTFSTDFPTTADAFQTTLRDGDAFVTKFAAAGTSLVYSTLLGGTGSEAANAIAVDGSNRAYVTGVTNSSDFPVTPGVFEPTFPGTTFQTGFVTKLQRDGKGLIYSSYLGGSETDQPSSIAVDSSGQAHVVGATQSANFPLRNPLRQFGGLMDAFVTKISASGSTLLYSTYLGGSGGDSATSVRLDSDGNAYVGGSTFSANFPTTPGAFNRTRRGNFDGWVVKIKP